MSKHIQGACGKDLHVAEKSPDAMFLDNRSGCHFNIVIGPGDL